MLWITLLISPLARGDNLGRKSIEEALAISTVVSDSDALTFGIANFDLQYIFDPEDPNWGDEETLELKKSLDIFVVPYSWQLKDLDPDWSHKVSIRAFYIEVNRENLLFHGLTNVEKERVIGAYGNYMQHYGFSKSWYGEAGLGLHLMHYENQFDYDSKFPPELRELLDGNVFNTTAAALISEPFINFGYKKQQSWGQWNAHNSNHYVYGRAIAGKANNLADINPKGWRIINGIEFKFDIPQLWGVSDFVAVDFKRIDVKGDMSRLSDDGYYYETTIGWVIDTNNKIPLLDNIGIGFTINYGSSLSGGTLSLYYNEE
ncbi:Solitary outer membrane autotransporter beta-barrel domain [Psychromonas aquimarina]|uniref:Solitary outer membrane autotransporter beta-barrel domain n=1 Tax=Psychromonas aquimarina TaxID=444919 RepID=UPI0003FAE936|nr:Solitary outer membrane autotransporter beta-barrel domain [Psychromonas aquimarina]